MNEVVADVDLDAVLAGGGINLPQTQKSYDNYLKKLKGFVEISNETRLLPKHLTDTVIAKFLHVLGVHNSHKPCHLKAASAALGSELIRNGMPGIYTSNHLYPSTTIVIKVLFNSIII
jgi:hypothetical protein